MSDGARSRLAAIVSADVVGYSRLMGADSAATLAALRHLRADLLAPEVDRHHGRIVKSMGDGWLIEFAAVADAIRCAVAVQEALSGHEILKLRVGLHLGDIAHEEEDVFGDGVNIAARLQAIAAPGGIVISDMARRSVDAKLAAAFADLGPQTLKNIAEPVAAWGWGMKAVAAAAAMPDKPSIAVLPFDNMSGDADQEFFADGVTEDIITELSRFAELFVIARNSVFTYKGRAVKPQEVGRDLGVRYVVEGSIRKAGDRVRVTVQLIEAASGVHLWAEKYDRRLVDVFDLQDEITAAIVGALPGRIRASEMARFERRPPDDMKAFDYLLAARIHHHRGTQEDNTAALDLLDKAIALDPRFAEAYAWKACTLGQAMDYGYCDDVEQTFEEARKHVYEAMAINRDDVECLRLLCEGNLELHNLEKAKDHADHALKLNPNDPRIVAQQGEILTWNGRADEGIDWLEKAFRLDPFNTNDRAHLLGRALYACRRYEEAADRFRLKTRPRRGHLAEFAACYAQAGMEDKARAEAEAELRANPGFSIAAYIASMPWVEQADRDHLAEGMRKAGLPE